MKERPILFNAQMVKAILEDRKTKTRRVVRIQPPNDEGIYELMRATGGGKKIIDKFHWIKEECILANTPYFSCPYGSVGDRLWVRETWKLVPETACRIFNCVCQIINPSNPHEAVIYKCGLERERGNGNWRPSIFMPRWASRILLEITDIKVERLQDITEEDAKREGMPDEYPIAPVYCPNCQGQGTCGAVHPVSLGYMEIDCPECDTAKKKFKNLWDSINGRGKKPGKAWDDNPWVWVVEFRRVGE